MKKIYFGHPVNTYNTNKEKEWIFAIKQHFPEDTVENPNQPLHQENYRYWKKHFGDGMDYYFRVVLPFIEESVSASFEDGMLDAGVYGKAEFLKKRGKLLYEINWDCLISKLILDPKRKLSIEDTRKRVYK